MDFPCLLQVQRAWRLPSGKAFVPTLPVRTPARKFLWVCTKSWCMSTAAELEALLQLARAAALLAALLTLRQGKRYLRSQSELAVTLAAVVVQAPLGPC